jgi:hypothetical protein
LRRTTAARHALDHDDHVIVAGFGARLLAAVHGAEHHDLGAVEVGGDGDVARGDIGLERLLCSRLLLARDLLLGARRFLGHRRRWRFALLGEARLDARRHQAESQHAQKGHNCPVPVEPTHLIVSAGR